MGIYEFNQEVYDEVLREDGEAIGLEKGIEIGRNEGMKIGRNEGMKLGRSQGIEIGTLTAIENVMSALKLTIEQAMDVLKIPKAEQVKYLGKVKGKEEIY